MRDPSLYSLLGRESHTVAKESHSIGLDALLTNEKNFQSENVVGAMDKSEIESMAVLETVDRS